MILKPFLLIGLIGLATVQAQGPAKRYLIRTPEETVGGMLAAAEALSRFGPGKGEPPPTDLAKAITAKDAPRVRDLLKAGASVHREGEGPDPLALAIMSHNVEIVRAVLDAGAGAKEPADDIRQQPLHMAVLVGDRAVIEELLTRGANPFVKGPPPLDLLAASHSFPAYSKESRTSGSMLLTARYSRAALGEGPDREFVAACGVTRLMALAYEGDVLGVKREVEGGADAKGADTGGWTALHWAAAGTGDRSEVVRILLAAGAAFHASDRAEQSPLSTAVAFGDVSTVRALLQSGQVSVRDGIPLAVSLSRAIAYDHGEAFRLLLERPEMPGIGIEHAADWAIGLGRVDLLRELLEKRADGVGVEKKGELLLAAIDRRSIDLVRLMLDHGAPLAPEKGSGWTPFERVAKVGDETVFALLLETAKTRGELETRVGRDRLVDHALLSAAGAGKLAMCQRLLESGADVNAVGHRGIEETPLMRAAGADKAEVVRFLLDRGANAKYLGPDTSNARDVMSVAAHRAGPEVFGILIAAGCDPKADGLLASAIMYRNEAGARALIQAGADVHALVGGRDLLLTAVQQSDVAIVRMLLEAGAKVKREGDVTQSHVESAKRMDKGEHSARTREILDLIERAAQSTGEPKGR